MLREVGKFPSNKNKACQSQLVEKQNKTKPPTLIRIWHTPGGGGTLL